MSDSAIATAEAIAASNQGNPTAVAIASVVCGVLFALILLWTAAVQVSADKDDEPPPQEPQPWLYKLLQWKGCKLLTYQAMIASPRWNGIREFIAGIGFVTFVAGTWNLGMIPLNAYSHSVVVPVYWLVAIALLYFSGTLLGNGGVPGEYIAKIHNQDTGAIILKVVTSFMGQRLYVYYILCQCTHEPMPVMHH